MNQNNPSSLSNSLAHSLLEPPKSPPPSPLILSKEQKRSSNISPFTLNNHLNNISTMSAQSPSSNEEDYSIFLSENGRLSFENPNYTLESISGLVDPARLDDHLNSNVVPGMSVFDEIRISEQQQRSRDFHRKGYASMDLSGMGMESAPKTTNLDNKITEEKMRESISKLDKLIQQETDLMIASKGEIESDKLVESDKEKPEKSDGEDDTPADNQTAAAVKVKMRRQPHNKSQQLPPGWEKHYDEEGPYFWQVKTGIIQREVPKASKEDQLDIMDSSIVRDVRSSKIFDDDFDPLSPANSMSNPHNVPIDDITEKKAVSNTQQLGVVSSNEMNSGSSMSEDKMFKRRSMPLQMASNSIEEGKAIQIKVRSLGSVELREDELTPENSSKSVNRCIVQLSNESQVRQQNVPAVEISINGKFGNGKDMILELFDGSLKLLNPDSKKLIHAQPIHSIRVWGVGRDNGQDFAYVAKDKHTRRHMCHVFRCEVPARAIANALRDICKKILIERSLVQSSRSLNIHANSGSNSSKTSKSKETSATAMSEVKLRSKSRPTSLGCSNLSTKLQTKTVPAPESFPTPMEEPRKVMKSWFLGTLQVSRPCGMEVINEAINELMNSIPRAQWRTASVSVAPSTINISFGDKEEPLDCRVRFLSFLGIGENPQQCAFIMHTAQDTFLAHVFHCEPTAGPMCKTIEAACKLRYQKCLDARPQRDMGPQTRGEKTAGGRASIGSTLKNMLGSWKKNPTPS